VLLVISISLQFIRDEPRATLAELDPSSHSKQSSMPSDSKCKKNPPRCRNKWLWSVVAITLDSEIWIFQEPRFDPDLGYAEVVDLIYYLAGSQE